MVLGKLSMIVMIYFFDDKLKIATLTYGQIYLQLLVLNNATSKFVYDSYKIIFCHENIHNDNIIKN